MEIARIDNEKNINRTIDRLVFIVGDSEYTITDTNDGFMLHKGNGETIYIRPSCANQIVVVG